MTTDELLYTAQKRITTLVAERDALDEECERTAHQRDQAKHDLAVAIAERDALRAALVSLVDGKSEFDIEYDTGMDASEARKIMDLAYNR